MAGPLTTIRVLENASFISGPYAGMLLADLGAEVTKVERPGAGDPFRRWSGRDDVVLPQFAAFNRGKRSVTINLKDEPGRAAYLRLAAEADVVLENFRPGTLDGLGIGYQQVRNLNPGVVYCSVPGMGSHGPYRMRPTYDAIAQALSGLWSQFTDLAHPRPAGPALADQLTGLFAAYGVLGALLTHARTGTGQHVEASMLSAALGFMTHPIAEYTMNGEVSGPTSRPRRSQTYAFVGSDGRPFGIHLSSPVKFWQALTEVLGMPELADDARFATTADRVRNYDALHTIATTTFATKPRSEWLALLDKYDVPAAPIYDIAEALDDPHVRQMEMTATFGTGDRALRLAGFPVTYAATPCEPTLPPPHVGEHTDAVLGELGYEPATIQAMRSDGAI